MRQYSVPYTTEGHSVVMLSDSQIVSEEQNCGRPSLPFGTPEKGLHPFVHLQADSMAHPGPICLQHRRSNLRGSGRLVNPCL